MDQTTKNERTPEEINRRMGELLQLPLEDRYLLCDMGCYNKTIAGYLIAAMENSDFSKEEIYKALHGLHLALDDVNAKEAEAIGMSW